MARIINLKLCDTFRQAGHCEWCGTWFGRLECSHTFAKGHGGGGDLDVALNLTSLCRQCHQSHHDGNSPTRDGLIAVAARRLGLAPARVLEELYRLMRAGDA